MVKSSIRHILYKECKREWKNHIKRDKVSLTLSNVNFELEKQLLNHGKVICVEFDKEVYDKAKKRLPANIHFKYDDIFKISQEYPYDFVWMDLCNSYSEKILQNVVEFIKNTKFTQNSIFAITFCKQRGSIEHSKLYQIYGKFKDRGVVSYLGNFFKNEIKEIKSIDYNCFDISTRASIMTVFIFKLGKLCQD